MEDTSALDFGAQLAAARQRRGLSLEDIAKRTKISSSVLAAIERCEVGHLPGGLYVREFLRAFAREAGCEPEDIVRQYRERFREQILAADPMDVANPDLQLTCASGQVSVADIDARTRRRQAHRIGRGAVALLIAATYVMLRSNGGTLRKNQPSPVRASSAAVSSRVPTPPATATATAAVPTTEPSDRLVETSGNVPASELRLSLRPTATCWISARADGRSVLYRLMQAGEGAQISAREELVLTVGDPAGCGFEINGAAARQLGSPGKPVTIHITPRNFADFLQQS